jgi:hypothetical protein
MARLLTAGALLAFLTLGSIGCATCSSCGTCGHGKYWRNLGLPGKHPVGHSWCRGCDLCTDVGGPCGLWSQTAYGSSEGSVGCTSCGEGEVIYEGAAPTASRLKGNLRVAGNHTQRKW